MDALTACLIARFAELDNVRQQLLLAASDHPIITLQVLGALSVLAVARSSFAAGR